MAQQLQQKLDDIINAAQERRKHQLDEKITAREIRTRRKNQQMSELKFKWEQEKMDRWNKLQQVKKNLNEFDECLLCRNWKP